jgi:hypothetical protein
MRIPEPKDLSTLRSILAAATADAIDTLGLLGNDLKPSGYDQTPAGCMTFAWTGGDGVHFSLADTGTGIGHTSPVVMTVPMQFDAPNLVVGRTLRDFLALGLPTGYFVLEQLAYDRSDFFGGGVDPGLTPDQMTILDQIARTFEIRPWQDPERHLDALNRDFASLLAPARDV